VVFLAKTSSVVKTESHSTIDVTSEPTEPSPPTSRRRKRSGSSCMFLGGLPRPKKRLTEADDDEMADRCDSLEQYTAKEHQAPNLVLGEEEIGDAAVSRLPKRRCRMAADSKSSTDRRDVSGEDVVNNEQIVGDVGESGEIDDIDHAHIVRLAGCEVNIMGLWELADDWCRRDGERRGTAMESAAALPDPLEV
jgi:hypothetical protein